MPSNSLKSKSNHSKPENQTILQFDTFEDPPKAPIVFLQNITKTKTKITELLLYDPSKTLKSLKTIV